MARSPVVTALFVLLAVVALTNPVWLFPAEGERRHTYTRVPVEVADGRLAYDLPDRAERETENDLEGVGCDYSDGSTLPRGCAFDRYLRENGPVTVENGDRSRADPPFVFLNGSYYARTQESAPDGTTYDVERASAERVRRELAEPATNQPYEHAPVEVRVVRRGGTMRSTSPPSDRVLGRIYRVRDGYYTAAYLGTEPLDRPFVSPLVRGLLAFAGLGSLWWAGRRVTASRRDAAA